MIKKSFLIILVALLLFIPLEFWCETDVYQKDLKKYQKKFELFKSKFQKLNVKMKSNLTKEQKTKLKKKLQSYLTRLQLSFNKLQHASVNLGISKRKYFSWDYITPEAKIDRLIAILEAAVDYVVMLAMQSQQQQGSKDKDAQAAILNTLKNMENTFQKAKSEKLFNYLEGKITKKKDDD